MAVTRWHLCKEFRNKLKDYLVYIATKEIELKT